MTNVKNIDDKRPHRNYRAVCFAPKKDAVHGVVYCFHKWIATTPVDANLTKLECPKCGESNSFTAPILENEK